MSLNKDQERRYEEVNEEYREAKTAALKVLAAYAAKGPETVYTVAAKQARIYISHPEPEYSHIQAVIEFDFPASVMEIRLQAGAYGDVLRASFAINKQGLVAAVNLLAGLLSDDDYAGLVAGSFIYQPAKGALKFLEEVLDGMGD